MRQNYDYKLTEPDPSDDRPALRRLSREARKIDDYEYNRAERFKNCGKYTNYYGGLKDGR